MTYQKNIGKAVPLYEYLIPEKEESIERHTKFLEMVKNLEADKIEEISEEQSRQTIVTLYFQNKETKELVPEARMVDIKEMVNTPYDKLINLLIEGPKNEKLERIITENTKLLGTKIDGECITVDFSAEILNYDKTNEKSKDNLINSIELR